jgi:bifunctional UDP-N-acetylglucosamine pyrophosphorylase/glucosamine-1-phosphate N-acetyltransferase
VTEFNAIVMAAGKGTRMRSRTPKVLHELCGRPMVRWTVDAAIQAGAHKVVVVRSPSMDLSAALPDGTIDAVQDGDPGTAGAVAAGLPALDGDQLPIIVLNCDHPLIPASLLSELVAAHVADGGPGMIASAIVDDPGSYGRVVRDGAARLARVVETKVEADATSEELAIREVNSGIYCFDADALRGALPRVGSDNAQGERYLPEVLSIFTGDGTSPTAHSFDDPRLMMSINDRVELARVTDAAQQQILEQHMRAGVTVVNPASTTVDADVVIGEDTVLEPGTHLRGATSVGQGATIGPHVVAVDAVIEDGVSVGPFAYLRPGTVVRQGAKIGTFVEIKNSVIGAGAKVPHLSYIGDADVGAGTNLGAVTITANYNARTKTKSRTTIGDDVKTGVLTALVAPVSLGKNAYTGAGSTVTEDVPAGALAVSRGKQKNIGGYAG